MIYCLSLLLPVIGAAAIIGPRGKHRWKSVLVAACAAETLCNILLALLPARSFEMFRLLDLSFILCGDPVGCFFAILFSVLFLSCGIYATAYLEHDKRPDIFSIIFLLTLSAMIGLCYAGDLATYYMFFECLTLVSFALILHDRRDKSRWAAVKYLCYSLIGAALVLFGMVFLKHLLGDLTFVPGGHAQTAGKMLLAVGFITVMGFGCKAGLMPLHDWLPVAHPEAPAPASAILSGCVTKAGVLGIARTMYYVIGAKVLSGTWVQTALIVLTLVTVFCGSMLAFKENILKKRLAYSTVSQVSYALFGLVLFTPAGFLGAILQVLFHALTKVCLFLSAGSMLHGTERETVRLPDGRASYAGLAKTMPLTAAAFTLASLSLVGLPPFGGFVSKWYLANGSFASLGVTGWIGAAVLLVSALLTAGYLLSISRQAFFPADGEALPTQGEHSRSMTLPLIILAGLLAVLGIFCIFLGTGTLVLVSTLL